MEIDSGGQWQAKIESLARWQDGSVEGKAVV